MGLQVIDTVVVVITASRTSRAFFDEIASSAPERTEVDFATVIVRVLSHSPSREVTVIFIAVSRVSGRFVFTVGAIFADGVAVCGTPVITRLPAYRVDTGVSGNLVCLHTPTIQGG